jgi:nucleoside-diphosphate-sugar epimerase
MADITVLRDIFGGIEVACLVTGGTGFVGAEIIRMVRDSGHTRLYAFQRSQSLNRLEGSPNGMEILRGDLGDFAHAAEAVKTVQPKMIYHLGAMLSTPSEDDPSGAIRTSVNGTFNVLEAARLFDVPQVLFASSVATFGPELDVESIPDTALQRPQRIYGATKVFGEHMGRYFKRRYGIDFRGLRYPSVVGPNVTTPAVVQFTSWVIEQFARGNAFEMPVSTSARVPIMYYKDAARAMIELGNAALESIKTGMYNIAGISPVPSAEELATCLRSRVPGARITFLPDSETTSGLQNLPPMSDANARAEWGWTPQYDLDGTIDDFLEEMNHASA